jgi:hypothetical protein
MVDVFEPTLFEALVRGFAAARDEDVEATRAQLAIIGARDAHFLHALPPMAMLGEVLALAGTDDRRRLVRDALARADRTDVVGTHVSFTYDGTALRVLGLLDASLGDLTGAEANLRAALDLATRRRHRPWVAQISYELGNVLATSKRSEARALHEESLRDARELGMTSLVARASAKLDARPATTPTPAIDRVSLTLAGEVWTVERGGSRARVKDGRGVRLLAKLVERPGEEIHVLALAADEGGGLVETNAGEMIDARARDAYRARLAAIDEETASLGASLGDRGDAARVARLARERSAIVAELSRATGLGGRTRHAASATERARVNVQRRVKDAIARIAEVDAALGRFFEQSISTGTFCCFRP